MKKSHFGIAALLSIAGLALSVVPTSTSANSAAAQIAPVQGTDAASDELSAQGRRGGGFGGGFRGGGGNIGRIQGGNIGRQQGRIGRIDGRIGRQQGRIGRQEGRIGRIDGRIGVVPVPVPVGPGPGPGLGVVTPPCLVCPVQACLIAVYSDPNLTGATFETRDNQPRLDQVAPGWQNQISSVMVKGGTWEFYPDLEYRGGPPVLRLYPGSYVVLEPQWTKRIGSFMCVR
jgi:hypothetical protein